MSTVNTGWLKDKNGDKFAPKTLLSQVMAADGSTLESKMADKADSDHTHDDKYDPKGAAATSLADAKTYADNAAATSLADAKTYADNAANTVKNDLLNGAGAAYDTLKELGDLIDENKDAVQALNDVAAGKADKEHTHSWNNLEDRPFYETDPVPTEIVNGTFTAEDLLSAGIYLCVLLETTPDLAVGSNVTVTYDSVTYNTTVKESDGIPYIGNISILDPTFEDTGEPFFIGDIFSDGSIMVATTDTEATEHTISVVLDVTEIIKLDEKFLPEYDLVGMTTTGTEYTIEDVTVTASNGAEIFNDYVDNIASGQYSHAEGRDTIASGMRSHAEGYFTKANGNNSHAEGQSTIASGHVSHAEGYSTIASSDYSHVEGSNSRVTSDTTTATSTTSSTTAGYCGHAEGYGTVVTGRCGHAEGNGTKASGYESHAEGRVTTASGNYGAHAEGYETIASGNYGAHAEGYKTTASGIYGAHAEGYSTIASGQYSHAEGSNTVASAYCSHAEGYRTKASTKYQHVQGRANIEDTVEKYAHIVGNGESDTVRSNAHTLDWSGNAWFAGDVYVGGTSQDDAENVKKLAKEDHNHDDMYAALDHSHSWDDLSDKPTIPTVPESLKNPNALIIQGNGTDLGSYDGSEAKSINITPANIGAIPTSEKGAASGVAELDSSGKVPSSQLPSYVDDILEYTTMAAFPSTGETGKIYVATTTNKTYRWSGSGYVEVSQSIALGETSSTAYRGDRGKIAYQHTTNMENPHNVTAEQIGTLVMSLNSTETTPTENGAIAWTYE